MRYHRPDCEECLDRGYYVDSSKSLLFCQCDEAYKKKHMLTFEELTAEDDLEIFLEWCEQRYGMSTEDFRAFYEGTAEEELEHFTMHAWYNLSSYKLA
ncbi:hypothetical protein [Priestia koreensis]|uniref:Uncharacterized protein n=1 Tax=Priestia koreensis TaxID=284581 RepID=A0A0M0L508_9BACI|nr:hypothetical protein [Priestia koreensis]KOO46160.1 hypothetical protein AMD01_09850 [Priestia koreensis]MCM3004204.1 hypothetical protein [Priestia koreensis]UNL83420.1 hypothetical protein IE339_14725 [Priestia koreensis]